MDDSAMREELELRLDLARYFRSLRTKSRFASNLSAAARAAGITPSYLHRIEGAEVQASADCYVKLCGIYDVVPTAVLRKLGKLDSETEARLVSRLDTHWGLIDDILSIPPELVAAARRAVAEVRTDETGKEHQNVEALS